MGIQINGQNDTISAGDGGLVISGQELNNVTDINASGIGTFGNGLVLTGGDITLGTGVTASGATANEFSVSTNGSERVRVDSSGRLAIGTTSPSALLHATGNALFVNTGDNLDISLDSTYSTIIEAQLTGASEMLVLRTNRGIKFDTGGSTERARIDSSGRLLVGTSTSATNDTLVLQGNSAGSTFGAQLRLRRNATIGSGSGIGDISFEDGSGNQYAVISGVGDGTSGTGDYPGRLVFSTTADGASSPTERMRIASNGEHRAFADTDCVLARVGATGTDGWIYWGAYGATSTTTGTLSFGVYANGNVVNTNNSYGAISDVKLKENIVDASSQWSDIKALQVRNYNFKEGQTHTQIGLIAQEVELVSPGLVSESPDRDEDGNDLGTVTKSVNYSVLYMKAVKALQEAMERIEQLETEMAAVKTQLA